MSRSAGLARPARLQAMMVAGLVVAGAITVQRLAPPGRSGPHPTSPGAQADSSHLFGVPRSILERGHEEALAARGSYLEDPARSAVLRRLDERTEAWEVRGLRYARLASGSPYRKEVLLTFDDGPTPAATPKVLEILRRERVPALFFVIGERLAAHPDLAKQALADGHALGNHTWHHAYLTRMEPDGARAQIEATRNAIRSLTGVTTNWFRPPGGHYDPNVVRVCRDLNQVIVLWNDTPGDWQRPSPEAIEARALRNLRPGGIILLHDTLPETVAMLPGFIRQARARGYRFVGIDRFAPNVRR